MSTEIHKNDIGTKFLLTVMSGSTAVDISLASEKKIIFKKTNGDVLTKDGVFETDGSDGKIYYTSIDGDLNLKGDWNIQTKITLPSGVWYSSVLLFEVHVNIEV